MTMTLEVPDELAERLQAFAVASGLTPAESLLRLIPDVRDAEPDAVEALREAFAELDAGDPGIPADEYFEKLLSPPKP